MPQIKSHADLVKTVSEFLEALQGVLPTSEPDPEPDPRSEWARLNPGLANTFFAPPEPKPQQIDNALKLAIEIRKLKNRVHSHAQHINLLHDDEATTRNMVIHAENIAAEGKQQLRELVTETEALLRKEIFNAEERCRQRFDAITAGALEASED